MKFRYTRLSQVAETGVLSVDVQNPANPEEIKDALIRQEWSTYLPYDRGVSDAHWEFDSHEEPDDEDT